MCGGDLGGSHCSSYALTASLSLLSPAFRTCPHIYRSNICDNLLNWRVNGSMRAICRMGNRRIASPRGTNVLLTERSQACGSRWVRMNFASG